MFHVTQTCFRFLTAVTYRRVKLQLTAAVLRCCSSAQCEVRVRFAPSPTGKVLTMIPRTMSCMDITKYFSFEQWCQIDPSHTRRTTCVYLLMSFDLRNINRCIDDILTPPYDSDALVSSDNFWSNCCVYLLAPVPLILRIYIRKYYFDADSIHTFVSKARALPGSNIDILVKAIQSPWCPIV